jgi:hypothetical protein
MTGIHSPYDLIPDDYARWHSARSGASISPYSYLPQFLLNANNTAWLGQPSEVCRPASRQKSCSKQRSDATVACDCVSLVRIGKAIPKAEHGQLGVAVVGVALGRLRDECLPDEQPASRFPKGSPSSEDSSSHARPSPHSVENPHGLGEARRQGASTSPSTPSSVTFTESGGRQPSRRIRDRNEQRTFKPNGHMGTGVQVSGNDFSELGDVAAGSS